MHYIKMKLHSIIITVLLCILISIAYGCGKNHEADNPPLLSIDEKPMEIIIAADLHYLAGELNDNSEFLRNIAENADGKTTLYSEELIDAFLSQVIKKDPDVLILSGDLTFNGEKISHMRLAEKLRCVKDAGISVLVIPGNHDMYRTGSARFTADGYEHVESITAKEFKEIYWEYGFGEAVSADAASLSYVSAPTPGLSILMTDVNTASSPGCIKEETAAWISEQLAKADKSGNRVITVSHQNLLDHSPLISDGFTMGNAKLLTECYEDSPVILNLSGHIHMQHMARTRNGLWDIATSSLAVTPNQYGVLEAYGSGITYSTETVDVAGWAEEHGLTNPDLTNFADYASRFFRDTCIKQAVSELGDSDTAMEMAEFFADINTAYFAGRTDTLSPDGRLLGLWESQNCFLSAYIESIVEEIPHNSCELELVFTETQ